MMLYMNICSTAMAKRLFRRRPESQPGCWIQ